MTYVNFGSFRNSTYRKNMIYQVIVYTDPLIQNNLPIFISQVQIKKAKFMVEILILFFC